MGLYFSAEDWFARTGAGSCGGRKESRFGVEARSRGRGQDIAVPKGEKDSGVKGSGVMRRGGEGTVSVGAGIVRCGEACGLSKDRYEEYNTVALRKKRERERVVYTEQQVGACLSARPPR